MIEISEDDFLWSNTFPGPDVVKDLLELTDQHKLCSYLTLALESTNSLSDQDFSDMWCLHNTYKQTALSNKLKKEEFLKTVRLVLYGKTVSGDFFICLLLLLGYCYFFFLTDTIC